MKGFAPTTVKEIMLEAGVSEAEWSWQEADLEIRIAAEDGERGILSMYISDCGKYVWLDIDKANEEGDHTA